MKTRGRRCRAKKDAMCANETWQDGPPPCHDLCHDPSHGSSHGSSHGPGRRYVVPVVSKALLVLDSLHDERGSQKLEDIRRRTGIARATLYRILKTLVVRGYAIETQKHTFKAAISQGRKIQIGFGISNQDRYVARDILGKVSELAIAWGVKLLVLDNEDGKAAAVRNANEFIRAGVEVVFESFVDPQFSPIVGEMLRAAGKPTVAIESPLPDATYFGMDNYRAGFDAGKSLAKFAGRAWGGEADCFVGVCSRATDSATHRIQGALAGIRSAVRLTSQTGCEILAPATHASIEDRVRTFFARHGRGAKVLILATDETAEDETAKTVRQMQRAATTAIARFSSGAGVEGFRPDRGSPIVASVYCERDSYAHDLLHIGLAVRAGSIVPPYNHAKHIIVDHLSHTSLRRPSAYCVDEDLERASIHAS